MKIIETKNGQARCPYCRKVMVVACSGEADGEYLKTPNCGHALVIEDMGRAVKFSALGVNPCPACKGTGVDFNKSACRVCGGDGE